MYHSLLLLFSAYLLGSFPSGLIIGKLFYNVDIREHGSGNLGATNTLRILGKKAGIIVTILDISKGSLAVLLPLIFNFEVIDPLYFGLLAIIGHIFPIFANFRGGKAVATSCGVILAYSPILFLVSIATFIITLVKTKYVSASALTATIAAFIYTTITFFSNRNWHLFIFICFLTVAIFILHRDNIKRLKNKTEAKITWK